MHKNCTVVVHTFWPSHPHIMNCVADKELPMLSHCFIVLWSESDPIPLLRTSNRPYFCVLYTHSFISFYGFMIRLYFVLTWRRCSSFMEAHYHDALINLCHLSCATIAIYNTQLLILIYVILMQSHSTFLSPRLAGQLNRMLSSWSPPVSWTSQ